MTDDYLTPTQLMERAIAANLKDKAAFADKIQQLIDVPKNHNGPLAPPAAPQADQTPAPAQPAGLTPNRSQGHAGTAMPVEHPDKAQQLRELFPVQL